MYSLSYFSSLFTDFIISANFRYTFGYGFIGLFVIQALVNLTIAIISSIKVIILVYKRKVQLKKNLAIKLK
jgi:hypothetical protein